MVGWLLRNAPRNWHNLNRDLQEAVVDYVEGPIIPRMSSSPGIIRLAMPYLTINGLKFLVDQEIFYQIKPMGNYRVYYSSYGHYWLGAVPLAEQSAPNTALLAQFNSQELEILHLIAEGLSNQEIALKLHLSINTVKMYTSQIYRKLNVRRRNEAVAHARTLGLL